MPAHGLFAVIDHLLETAVRQSDPVLDYRFHPCRGDRL